MKINSISTITGHSRKKSFMSSANNVSKSAYERTDKLKQNKNDQISTTIKSNSDGRASFKGGVPLLHQAANFAHYSPLIAESLFAILITCGLRPLTIMATAKTKEDKEKCSYQAAKSVSSGLVGLGMTAIVGTPIASAAKKANQGNAFKMPEKMKEKSTEIVKEGVNALNEFSSKLVKEGKDSELVSQIADLTHNGKLNLNVFANKGKNADKAFQNSIKEKAPEIADTVKNAMKEQTVINNYSKTAKNVADKFFQPIFMPVRATITIAMVPILLGLVGKKKPSSKPKEEENMFNNLKCNVLETQNEEKVFQTFSGVAKYANK